MDKLAVSKTALLRSNRSTPANQRKEQQLGMSFGKACHRLRGLILFDLLERSGLNVCHVCGQKINSPSDLSIQHKKPWLYTDTALFWDIDNIAFAHRICNSRDKRPSQFTNTGGAHSRKVGPPGTFWCCGHKSFLPTEEFTSNASNWNGVEDYCRTCRSSGRR